MTVTDALTAFWQLHNFTQYESQKYVFYAVSDMTWIDEGD